MLLRINAGISPDLQHRCNELVAKRQAEIIPAADLTELMRITDAIEQQDAQRLAALIALVQLRQTTVSALMDKLGIWPPAHA